MFYRLCIVLIGSFALSSCSSSSGGGLTDSSIVDSSLGYEFWPNSTTTQTQSNEIASKILTTDLDGNGFLEHVFISVVRRSSHPEGYILRLTEGNTFNELSNYSSIQVLLYQEAIPFAYDFNKDGSRELLFVSYNLRWVHAFQIKNKDLSQILVRWSQRLPSQLPNDFEKKFKVIDYQGQEMVQVGEYGLYEESGGGPKIVTFSSNDDDD